MIKFHILSKSITNTITRLLPQFHIKKNKNNIYDLPVLNAIKSTNNDNVNNFIAILYVCLLSSFVSSTFLNYEFLQDSSVFITKFIDEAIIYSRTRPGM